MRLYRNSKSVRVGSLALKYAPNGRESYRLAVVVSRKVSKSAVVRNRIRRRIYENVRILSSTFAQPYDLVLLAYDATLAELPPAELTNELNRIVKKAKLTSAISA
jgi:ribonuclease P protein component